MTPQDKAIADQKAAGIGLNFLGQARGSGAAVWAGNALYNDASQRANKQNITIYTTQDERNLAKFGPGYNYTGIPGDDEIYDNYKRRITGEGRIMGSLGELYIKDIAWAVKKDSPYWTPRVLREPDFWRPLFPEVFDAAVKRHETDKVSAK